MRGLRHGIIKIILSCVFGNLSLLFWLLNVNGYILKGHNSAIFIFISHLIRDKLLKIRICSYRSKFILLREDPILRRLRPPAKQLGSHKNCFPMTHSRKRWKFCKTSNLIIQMIRMDKATGQKWVNNLVDIYNNQKQIKTRSISVCNHEDLDKSQKSVFFFIFSGLVIRD